MATFARNVDVEWTGGLMDGKGEAKAGSGAFTLPVTFPNRIGEAGGKTSPEELMAAAHAACFAMAMNAALGKKGGKATKVRVNAKVTADKGDAGIKVVSSHLTATVEGLEGIDKAKLSELAAGAEKGCPISNAIRGNVTVSVDASAV